MALTKLRSEVVNQAEYVVAHGAHWLYEEIRPIPVAAIKAWTGRKDIRTDCSGSVIGIYARAGAPDPGGYHYSGSGNTDSFYHHCEHLKSYTDVEPGDLIDVTLPSRGTVHVYLVVSKSPTDIRVFSHGGPMGKPPALEMLSAVKGYWYSSGHVFTGLQALPLVEKAPSWVVLNGRGHRLATTNHPVTWAMGHPKSFRKFSVVRFVRR
jgi:hypothetical protein